MTHKKVSLKISNGVNRRLFLRLLSLSTLSTWFIQNTAFSQLVDLSQLTLLNIVDFGARGDGIHDDSPAFQKACDYAKQIGGARIHLPDPIKYYRLTFPIYLSSNTEIYGQGATTKIIFEDPIFNKGRGGFVIGSSLEANSYFAHEWYRSKKKSTTINPDFKNPVQRQYLRDNPEFVQAENSLIHDVLLQAIFTSENEQAWGGYGINFVNARDCHAYNIWGMGWTQLIGMGSDVPPETPSNHNCSAKNLVVIKPDLRRTYYSIGFIANSTNCTIDNARQDAPMTANTPNGSGVATNLCEDCIIKNITIPDLGRTNTSEGILINNSSGCVVENIFIGNAKTAVSVFYSMKDTLNPLKPNTLNKIEGKNCDAVLTIYSKYNVIKNVTGEDCSAIIVLKNNNATHNEIYSSPGNVSAPENRLRKFTSNNTFISSQLK
ncbi:glycosyl hydrolase family 28-related protein [Rahnella sp. PAMC 25559]|uniref:glycosyl hydrolase family 28-related protein n=1 Tax=Rahnella sp. PAMC 25559 TaxID=3423225 RepID=UPI003D676FD6